MIELRCYRNSKLTEQLGHRKLCADSLGSLSSSDTIYLQHSERVKSKGNSIYIGILRRMGSSPPKSTLLGSKPLVGHEHPQMTEVLSGEHDRYRKLKNAFLQYATAHACEENIQYLVEFEKLKVLRQRTLGEKDSELAFYRAIAMVDKYILKLASHSLNIGHTLKMRVEQSVDASFDELFSALKDVAREVALMLELNLYGDFIDQTCG
ncbi:hypothetical protein SARC_06130 [Sphaeroforma arctica JP610]|uniref:RGS domain-containing protein n=1 Tax=Sphaeroforma arctica JP610 TaxID=667725 RepID=A0A0L0FXI9_9EUKA|nr:hypothetical protein SARC_06130 [Sphaeroforma arctica JP610]KNC81555.1 hypothetical protein SARC_06130 [Sphaeroforma arctica JP610]|eukprot:XP_014155457.1 hypothetical protein SARC_06130 [Sphaeroforma arctica JP610]